MFFCYNEDNSLKSFLMTQNIDTLNLYDFSQRFPTEDSARLFFENNRWKSNGRICSHCGSVSTVECKNHKPMSYRCKDCRKHFSVRTGTVLEESRLPLQKWLIAIYMMTTACEGISSTQMAQQLGITQKSAWFLAKRIRKSWLYSKIDNNKLDETVEIDETFIGEKGKE